MIFFVHNAIKIANRFFRSNENIHLGGYEVFEIKYRIVEDIKELLLLTPEVFDDDFNDFEGQIELDFKTCI